MDEKLVKRQDKEFRKQMISFIVQTIRQLDTRKLRNVYNFVRNIK